MSAQKHTARHIPALDGIRGVALIAVFLRHFGFLLFYGKSPLLQAASFIAIRCWFGVDLFFVLSGFLITGILLDTQRSERYFQGFYIRRTLRIFPLYYLVLAVIIITNLVFRSGLLHLGYFLFYLQNYLPFSEILIGHDPKLLIAHTWSLAVEEQFYLVWPFIVWLVRSRKVLLSTCIVVIAADPIARAIAMHMGIRRDALYDWSLFRVDTLLWGAMAALLVRMVSAEKMRSLVIAARIMTCIGLVSLGVLYYTVGGFTEEDPYINMIGFTLYALTFTGLVLLVQRQKGMLHRVAVNGVLRWFGKYSYGIYIYHFLLFNLAWQGFQRYRHRVNPHLAAEGIFWGYLALICAISWLSYNLYEARWLRMKDKWAPRAADPASEKNETALSSA